jgi:hypothetical protein
MRRHTVDDPVRVQIRDDKLSRFRWAGGLYEVTGLLKMIAVRDPRGDVDTQLWQVVARSGAAPCGTYEIQCDHGEWRLTAVWDR